METTDLLKRVRIIAVLMFISLRIMNGQDRIITIQNDTIHCRIVSISSTNIQYEQRIEGYTIGKFIPIEQVLTYLRRSQQGEINTFEQTGSNAPKPEHRWVIGVYPGGGSILASTANDENEMIAMGIPKSQAVDYNKKLKQGWSIGSDIHYMFSDYFGLGAKYSLFTSSVQKDFTIQINNMSVSMIPEFACVGMNERMYIHYAGPSVIFRQWLDDNRTFQLTEMLSAGYVHYRDETRMDPNQYTFLYYPNMYGAPVAIYNILGESNTWGANVGLSVEYFPVPWLSVGVNAGFMYARLTKVDISTKETKQTVELDKKDYQSLARLDYSLGIRFHF